MKDEKEIILVIDEVKDYEFQAVDYDGFRIITNKQEVLLLIENGFSCCESYGYFVCDDNINAFIGCELKDISTIDTKLIKETLLKIVDNTSRIGAESIQSILNHKYGNLMFIEVLTSKGTLQFAAYNAHNGYYGHTALVISNQINLEQRL